MDTTDHDYTIQWLKNLESPDKQKILRVLFGRIERFPLSQLSFIGKFSDSSLDEECATWVDCGISILKQLYLDIYFAKSLLKPEDWDLDTFVDAMKLIRYMMKTVIEKDGILAKAARLCVKFDSNVYRAYSALKLHMQPFHLPDLEVQVTDTISAATFIELVVRNYCSRISLKDMKGAKFLEKLSEHRRFILGQEEFKGAQEKLYSKCNWHPATLCVVLDEHTGIVFTGATKPRLETVEPLQRAAKLITRMRLGTIFRKLIETSSETLWEIVNEGQLLDKIQNHTRQSRLRHVRDVRDVLSAVREAIESRLDGYWMHDKDHGPIYSVAFQDSFSPIPPCVRCNELYRQWTFPRPPDRTYSIDWQDWKHPLTGNQLRYNNGCSFCAETIAAAKFHYMFEGTATFVLPGEVSGTNSQDRNE